MAHAPTTSPISWASSRYGHCYRQIVPTLESGMYANIHRNLSKRLKQTFPEYQRKEQQKQSMKYYAYMKLLQRQRYVQRSFTGEQCGVSGSSQSQRAREVSDRLHSAINIYQPAESRPRPRTAPATFNFVINKPVYSRTEVESILDKLSRRNVDDDESDDEKKESQERVAQDRKNEAMKRFRKSQLYYPADDVRDVVEEFLSSSGGKTRGSPHRPFSARSCAHSTVESEISRDLRSCEKKRSKNDVNKTSQRLAKDEGEENDSRKNRRVRSAPPERTNPNSRKVSEKELDSIIERLTSYDNKRWPPESRGANKINVYK